MLGSLNFNGGSMEMLLVSLVLCRSAAKSFLLCAILNFARKVLFGF
jgi:hypothetical protein